MVTLMTGNVDDGGDCGETEGMERALYLSGNLTVNLKLH
jgi:hypothetical protein